jgi:hypothetical protein
MCRCGRSGRFGERVVDNYQSVVRTRFGPVWARGKEKQALQENHRRFMIKNGGSLSENICERTEKGMEMAYW